MMHPSSDHKRGRTMPLRVSNSLRQWSSPLKQASQYPIAQVLTPVSLLGGTAAIYASVLNHPSSTLTPISFLYMFLLAVHYAIQPRLSKKYIQTSSRSVALVEEVTKTTMAACLFACQPVKQVSDWTLSSSLTVAAIPAVLYAVQGVLQYASHQHLDPVTFNGLSQTKTLSAAFWCYILLGKTQTPLQLVALVLLFFSAMSFQGKTTSANSSNNNKQSTVRLWQGVLPCVAATMISGLAGALSQKGLQLTGIGGRDPFFFAMEVSFYSAVTLIVSRGSDWKGFFDGWTWKTMIPVVCKAAGGILTVLVHKYTGTVSKGFSLMFGLVLAYTMQSTLSREPMAGHQIIGTLLVMMSGWLHFTQAG